MKNYVGFRGPTSQPKASVDFTVIPKRLPDRTPGGRPNTEFKCYYLHSAPQQTGDRHTMVDSATETLRRRVRDSALGRFPCAFVSCA